MSRVIATLNSVLVHAPKKAVAAVYLVIRAKSVTAAQKASLTSHAVDLKVKMLRVFATCEPRSAFVPTRKRDAVYASQPPTGASTARSALRITLTSPSASKPRQMDSCERLT